LALMGRSAHQIMWWTAGGGEKVRDEGLVGFLNPRRYDVDDLLSINRRQTDLQREGRMERIFTTFWGSHLSPEYVWRKWNGICTFLCPNVCFSLQKSK